MDMSYEEAKAKLQAQNQEQVLANYSRLDESTQKELREQISKIDFKQFNKLYDSTKEEVSFENDVIEPISYIEESKISKEELNKYLTLGENAIKNGEYSVVTMAGGQGTRLGHSGPKGTFDIGLDSHKSIFEILVSTADTSAFSSFLIAFTPADVFTLSVPRCERPILTITVSTTTAPAISIRTFFLLSSA